MESFLRYIVPSCLFIGAMVWVGAEYDGAGGTSTNTEEQSSTCTIKSDAGEIACSSVSAAVLSSLNDRNQDGSQRTFFAATETASRSPVNSEIEDGGEHAGDTQSNIDSADIESAARLSETIGAETADSEQPQYIGEFIDPDAVGMTLLEDDNELVLIGTWVDPDTDQE